MTGITNDENDTTAWERGGDTSGHAPPPAPTYGRFVCLGSLGMGGMGVVLLAHDPQLDRRLALKLLRPDVYASASGRMARLRLLREAQAMARLSHPNVATIYEIGEAGDQLFIAMELVEGESLRAWARRAPRGCEQLLGVIVAAGRGLEAAHRAGLVHRDFKPDNVLMGRDGRPRVVDFGLVATGVGADRASDAQPVDGELSVDGAILGTPAYMAPEQLHGDAVDARSDQFSFAVTAWELLVGERPHAGARVPELRQHIERGAVAPIPRARGVPDWLAAALRRALAPRPVDRWPSMTALLDHLDRRQRRGRWAGLGAAASALAAVAATGALYASTHDRCPAPVARLEAVWSRTAEATLRAALCRIDAERCADRVAVAGRALDRFAREIGEMHVAACRATQVEGRQSDSLLDLRMRCLDQALLEGRQTLAQLLGASDVRAVDRAVGAAVELGALDRCADPASLAAGAPPSSREARAEADAIEAEVRALEVRWRAHHTQALVAWARATAQRAQRLGHPPSLAAALDLLGRAEIAAEAYPQAVETLEALALAASTAGQDDRVALAWSTVARLRAWELGKPDEALALLPAARAAAVRAGRPLVVEVERLLAEATVLGSHDRHDEAVAALAEAEARLRDQGAEKAGSALLPLLARVKRQVGATWVYREPARSLAASEDARALYERAYGAEHPELVPAYVNMAEAHRRMGRFAEARSVLAAALHIVEARVGDSPLAIKVISQMGTICRELRDHARAAELLERSHRMSSRLADHPQQLSSAIALGALYADLERYEDAGRMYEEAVVVAERNQLESPNVAIALYNRADIDARAGRCERAAVDLRRGLALLQRLSGEDSPYLPYLRRALGACLVRLGEHDEALAVLDRVLGAKNPGRAAGELVHAEYWVGRALLVSGRDGRSGWVRARAALDELRARDDVTAADLERLDRELAQVRGRGTR